MFVAKLFIVLLIVSAFVCSKEYEPVEAENVDPVEVEHHGPDLNKKCPRFHQDPCPVENYRTMARFGNPRVRSLDDVLQLVRDTPLEDFCRDIFDGLTCLKGTLLSIPEKCMKPGQHKGLVSLVNAGLTATGYLCLTEIENIKTHFNCFTSTELVMKTGRCFSPVVRGQCSEDQVIKCISRAIDETSSCQEGAKEVFERIAFRLALDIQPCAMLEEAKLWNRPSMFKFFK